MCAGEKLPSKFFNEINVKKFIRASEKFLRNVEYINFISTKILYFPCSAKNDEEKIAICMYPKLVELMKNGLSQKINGDMILPETAEIKASIQNHFRHHLYDSSKGKKSSIIIENQD